MTNPIGGFFELEDVAGKPVTGLPHPGSVRLSTARACISAILDTVAPARCYLPVYVGTTFHEPFVGRDIDIVYYNIGQDFLPTELPDHLEDSELFFYVNYFGLNTQITRLLALKYNHTFVLDNSQAFFDHPDHTHWGFNSARKFFGIADGAFLTGPDPEIKIRFSSADRFTPDSTANQLRKMGRTEEAYQLYLDYEHSLDARIFGLSQESETILESIDYERAANSRRENFETLSAVLNPFNTLNLATGTKDVPMCYPLLTRQEISRESLIEHGIYVPAYWADIPEDVMNDWETSLCRSMLPLPIDHRYDKSDMLRIINVLLPELEKSTRQ